MLKEFRDFAVKGNMLDMAVGIVIGAAFGTIIKSLVDNVLMPPLGLLVGNVDFANLFAVLKAGDPTGPYATLQAAQQAGAVTIDWGLFVNAVISFLLVAFALFFVVRSFNRMKKQEEEAPSSPPEPSAEERLLTEIRDLLQARG